ncbi:Molybdenum cofactor biosynthesis protein MoaA [hydrothermal vent metagenome]|uniref:Molybdenum cofactor biosynthesis protein MoaA n=1 Tax=hydrothermal vent metagenome TaxID=652676 RepID=A0A1W1C1G3_9ZZZZ
MRSNILSFEEIIRIVKIFAKLGVSKIRLTGGEPLLRKDITTLISQLNSIDNIKDIPISTNAHLLEKFALDLKKSGAQRLNISLDSLDKKRFADITRDGDLTIVLQGIEKALEVGLKVKINMVVLENFNEDEIENMLVFCQNKKLELRFIETMPIGSAGVKMMGSHYPKEKIIKRIEKYFNKTLTPIKSSSSSGPASMFQVDDFKVGIISAVSENFCSSCNRVRLTSKGRLILCLGQENSISLRDMIREGKNDTQITDKIIQAISLKPEKHFFNENINHIEVRNMVSIGG